MTSRSERIEQLRRLREEFEREREKLLASDHLGQSELRRADEVMESIRGVDVLIRRLASEDQAKPQAPRCEDCHSARVETVVHGQDVFFCCLACAHWFAAPKCRKP